MDPNTRALIMGAAGAGGAEKIYVEDVFSTWLYTGNGSTQTITNGIDLSGKGGLVWLKTRSSGSYHFLYDTARLAPNALYSNDNFAQYSETGSLSSFTSSGFNLGSFGSTNANAGTFASWTFREAAKFFDVVTYTGNGSNRTIAHSLGSVPGCIIVKRTDTSADWQVYHRSLANTEYLVLNSTAAKATGTTRWNSTTPTSTVFSLGTDATVNANGGTYVAYLFAHDAGGFGDSGSDSVISCGSYTGNGTTTGPTVTLGWEPQWLIIKNGSASGGWAMFDNMRGMYAGESDMQLSAQSSAAESTAGLSDIISITSTGFNAVTSNASYNASGNTYIYIAIRRGPMKTPTDATKVFDVDLSSTNPTTITTGFPVDLGVNAARSGNNVWWIPRLTGARGLQSNRTDAEQSFSSSYFGFDSNTSLSVLGNWWGSAPAVYWNFRRAPGFFDVVAYTGTGAAQTVSHNLGVAPELMIVKRRSTARNWIVYDSASGNTKATVLNQDLSALTNIVYWNNTSPTASVFTLGSGFDTNSNGDTYIAYLFASAPGVSKVGSYTGTGTTLNIDCGFTNGARFALIKRTDSTGDWYVWDTARGIVSGNDPYLFINSMAAEITNTDYIDPLNAGFQISSTAPAAINANGGSFIYLAVA